MNPPQKETVKDAVWRLTSTPRGQGFVANCRVYTYRSSTGEPTHWVVRLDNPTTKEKWIRPLFFNGSDFQLGKPNYSNGSPLYNLPALIKDQSSLVWLVEGEKCADTLRSKGLLATTSGSSSSVTTADWSPLEGREVVIWPDNDEAGFRYAAECEALLRGLDCSVHVLDVSALGLSEKEDCVDYILKKPEVSRDDLEKLVSLEEGDTQTTTPEELLGESREFPLYSLPPVIGEAIQEYQEYGQQPIPLVVSSALSAVSLACQGLANVARDHRLISPVSLYFLVVAESGERKTAADREFRKAVIEWETEKARELSEVAAKSYADLEAWEAEVQGIQNRIRNQAGKEAQEESESLANLRSRLSELHSERPQLTILPKLFHEIVTPEALISCLAEGWPSSSLWCDEGGLIVGGHSMNKEKVTEFLSLLNKLWDGSPISKRTKSSGNYEIRGRRFSCSLMLQNVVLRKLVSGTEGVSRGLGFMARQLVCQPTSSMGTRSYSEPREDFPAMERFHSAIRKVLNTPLPLTESGELNPPVLHLAPTAKKMWVEFHDQVERELSPDGAFSELKDFAAKAAENAARLAGCFQVFEEGNHKEVSALNMERAVSVMDWYLREAKRVLGLLEEPQELADGKRLLSWLYAQTEKAVELKQILQYGPPPTRKRERALPAIQLLKERGIVKTKPNSSGKSLLVSLVRSSQGSAKVANLLKNETPLAD